MKKSKLIKGILKLAEELKTSHGFGDVIIVNEMELLVDQYIEQLRICEVSNQEGQFSLLDLKQAFEEGEKHKYECSANNKDKKCYCKNDDDCTWRNQQTFEEWMKTKENPN